ncbi:DUF4275 family protein [Neobacillus sp. PS3-12]|uniref:DUF4275 family protein n=1 Tax=Neobacillus sp. PS3-12 TaxID=3070677 RepID=UPI0027DED9B5|nr:DUF4275 family protein [Neobacillus sp. PS3-12]WML52214.1 DUF4275 family protein [Neobacillus sp. PS3-12]
MGLITLLEDNGIVVTQHNKGTELRLKWINKFVGKMSTFEEKSIFIDQFLWHVFSYEKIKCLENKEANDAFNKQKKKVCYVFYQQSNNAYKLNNADKLKADYLQNEIDVYSC